MSPRKKMESPWCEGARAALRADVRLFRCPDGEPVRWEWTLPLHADGYCLACTWHDGMLVFVPPGVALWGVGGRGVEAWRCARWRHPAQLAFGVDADAAIAISVADVVRSAPAEHWPSIEGVTHEHLHALRWFHATAPQKCLGPDPDAAHAAKASRSLDLQLKAAMRWTRPPAGAGDVTCQPAATESHSIQDDGSCPSDESFRGRRRAFS